MFQKHSTIFHKLFQRKFQLYFKEIFYNIPIIILKEILVIFQKNSQYISYNIPQDNSNRKMSTKFQKYFK